MNNTSPDDSIKRLYGYHSFDSGALVTYLMPEDTFGILATKHLANLNATTKKERKSAAKAVERMMRTHGLLGRFEHILAVSTGSDSNGNRTIVVSAEQRYEESRGAAGQRPASPTEHSSVSGSGEGEGLIPGD